jgi:hypothetical protein
MRWSEVYNRESEYRKPTGYPPMLSLAEPAARK